VGRLYRFGHHSGAAQVGDEARNVDWRIVNMSTEENEAAAQRKREFKSYLKGRGPSHVDLARAAA